MSCWLSDYFLCTPVKMKMKVDRFQDYPGLLVLENKVEANKDTTTSGQVCCLRALSVDGAAVSVLLWYWENYKGVGLTGHLIIIYNKSNLYSAIRH